MTLALLTTIAMMVLPVALIIRGLRGVRVGDHPLCRKCGFDLFGRPAGTAVCGECGADLSGQKAIVIGHRLKRRKSLALGITLLMVSNTFIATMGYARAKHVNWWSHAPMWYVLREASSNDAQRRSPAIVELSTRFRRGLSQAEIERVTEAGLAYQGDAAKAWDLNWGALLEDIEDAGQMSPERWARYAKQALVSPSVTFPTEVKRGALLAWSVEYSEFRVARESNLSIGCLLSQIDVARGGNTNQAVTIELRPHTTDHETHYLFRMVMDASHHIVHSRNFLNDSTSTIEKETGSSSGYHTGSYQFIFTFYTWVSDGNHDFIKAEKKVVEQLEVKPGYVTESDAP